MSVIGPIPVPKTMAQLDPGGCLARRRCMSCGGRPRWGYLCSRWPGSVRTSSQRTRRPMV